MSQYTQPESRVERMAAGRTALVTRGPLFDTLDVAALIVLVIMNLGPLAAAAFWAPYH
jgi:hypothetical protein